MSPHTAPQEAWGWDEPGMEGGMVPGILRVKPGRFPLCYKSDVEFLDQ